ncbi:MAG: hypothetical protein HY619_00605 [Thaumarchaeota archaeon]|nr:hypothetical protein [Nitrososphaerota archaeon]
MVGVEDEDESKLDLNAWIPGDYIVYGKHEKSFWPDFLHDYLLAVLKGDEEAKSKLRSVLMEKNPLALKEYEHRLTENPVKAFLYIPEWEFKAFEDRVQVEGWRESPNETVAQGRIRSDKMAMSDEADFLRRTEWGKWHDALEKMCNQYEEARKKENRSACWIIKRLMEIFHEYSYGSNGTGYKYIDTDTFGEDLFRSMEAG